MGSKPKAPKYDVQYRTTDYIPTEYNVTGQQAMAQYAPNAMSIPEYNTESALAEQSRLNTAIGGQQYANVSSPLGGYSVSVDPATGQLTVNKSLSDNSQTALSKQLGALNTYTGDPTEAANAYYNAQMSYLQPQLDRQVERAESSLTNRGLPIGSSAWNEAMGNVYDSQNRALDALSNEALSRGQAYQGNILGQAQMLGGQVIDPSMVAGQAGAGLSDTYANQYNAALAQEQANYDNALLRYNAMIQDEANRYQNELNAYNALLNNNQGRYAANLSNNQGLYQNDLNRYQGALQAYQTKMAAYNADKQALSSALGTGVGTFAAIAPSLLGSSALATGGSTAAAAGGTAVAASDRRLKTDLRLVGKSDNGLNIYLGKYKPESGLDDGKYHLFLIAQEVKDVVPEAVIEDESGYLKVDYMKALTASEK
jgi:hypothetical protein